MDFPLFVCSFILGYGETATLQAQATGQVSPGKARRYGTALISSLFPLPPTLFSHIYFFYVRKLLHTLVLVLIYLYVRCAFH